MNNMITMSLPILLQHLSAMLPAVVVAVTVLVVMIVIALKRNHLMVATLSIVGLSIALFALILQMQGVVPMGLKESNLFVFDGFANVNTAIILVSALACCSLSYGYFRTLNNNKEELYLLILVSTLGAMLMTAAQHLASFFMALELLSVPMYGMLSYAFLKKKSLESGIKYLVLSATASATLLMGMAFVYADVGSMRFDVIGEKLLAGFGVSSLFVIGGVMMLVGIAFKLSMAPFHAWVGDVYEGAPVPVTAFLASVAKVAVVAVGVRLLVDALLVALPSANTVLTWMIVFSIVVGNLLALKQKNLKRLFAYSSIAHMGYVMIALVSIGSAADGLTTVYMLVYALSGIAAFGVITLMTGEYGEKDRNTKTLAVEDEADSMAVYQGLFWRRPVLTAVLTVMILSMAGMPMTAGFITKMQIIFSAVQGGRFGLAGLVVVGSAIGLYYYLKTILIMYKRPMEIIPFDVPSNWRIKTGGLILILITVFIVLMGILPNTLFKLAGMAILSI